MSIPSFSSDYYISHLQNCLYQLPDAFHSLPPSEIQKLQEELKFFGIFWSQELQNPQLDFEALEQQENITAERVQHLVHSYFSIPERQDIGVEFKSRLLNEIHFVKLTLQMNYLLHQAKSIRTLFRAPLGREIFFELAKWGDPLIKDILFDLVKAQPNDYQPHLIEALESLIKENSFLSTDLIVQLIKHDNHFFIAEHVVNLVLGYQGQVLPFKEALLQSASSLEPNAICTLFMLLTQLDLLSHPGHLQLMDDILAATANPYQPNESLQNILYAFLSEIPPTSHLAQAIVAGIEGFASLRPTFPVDKMLLYRRIVHFTETAALKKIDMNEEKVTRRARWEDYPLKLRLAIKILYVQRDRFLIESTLGDCRAYYQHPKSTVTSKCFPQAEKLYVGHNPDRKTDKYYCSFLADTLKDHFDVDVVTPHCLEDPPIGLSPNVIPLFGHEKPTKWLQDVCLIARATDKKKSQILFPRYTPPSEIDSLFFMEWRFKKMKSRAKTLESPYPFSEVCFPIMGKICSDGEQFKLLENHLENCQTLNDFKHTASFFEGGNILVGEDDQPYIIIGEDVLNMNRILIGNDLQALGLYKGQDSWKIKQDHLPSEKILLTKNEVKHYLALDCGLFHSSHVFTMPQLDYHIDMSACLLGPRLIVINDALESYRLQSSGQYSQIQRKELEKIQQQAIILSQYEAIAQKKLEEQGFNVIKIAGRCKTLKPAAYKTDMLNFFNFVTFRLKGKKRKDFDNFVVIALYCAGDDQERFKAMIELSGRSTDQTHFVFLDAPHSQILLENGGGISCLTKVLEQKFPLKNIYYDS